MMLYLQCSDIREYLSSQLQHSCAPIMIWASLRSLKIGPTSAFNKTFLRPKPTPIRLKLLYSVGQSSELLTPRTSCYKRASWPTLYASVERSAVEYAYGITPLRPKFLANLLGRTGLSTVV